MDAKTFRNEMATILKPFRSQVAWDGVVHASGVHVSDPSSDVNWWETQGIQDFIDSYFILSPSFKIPAPSLKYLIIPGRTESAYTKANLEHFKTHLPNIKPYLKAWSETQQKYRKSFEYKERLRKQNFLNLALEAGLIHDEHGGYSGRGDHFSINTVDYVWKKKDLKKYFACGKYLGLVTESRTRVYARSSKWHPSSRVDSYVVGTNENGVAFCHSVPNNISTLEHAIKWIWRDCVIEARHGDVGVADCKLKHVKGEIEDIRIIDSHYVRGEIYKKQNQIFVRNGVLYHKKRQHPDVEIGDAWKRIIVGRRSTRSVSSAD